MARRKTASARFARQRRVALAGSTRAAFAAAPAEQPLSPRRRVTVAVVVRRKQPLEEARPGRERLSRAQFRQRHGADPSALRLVRAFAKEFHLTVAAGSPKPGRRTLQLSGTVAAMGRAFGVTLSHQTHEGKTYRVRSGAIQLPEELAPAVEAVLGLDNRPQAKPHFRIFQGAAAGISYTPVEVAQLYQFPPEANATGQTIGLIELGGGYRAADLSAYFQALGRQPPQVTAVAVDTGKNAPGDASGADGEVMLDIEVCAAVAPGASIVVYFAPNTDQGFLDAVEEAIHDSAHSPSVISISWGGPESSWTAQAMQALDGACQAAAALGITITAAAGDDGSSDGGNGNNVDFPASSPYVLACGGTRLVGSGDAIAAETVWNELASGEGATGGGVSNAFPLPAWQSAAQVPAPAASGGGRGVPDVAGDADPATGYQIRVDGQNLVIGGTSAVAPLWAGLIALSNQANGAPAGLIQPTLYAKAAAAAFRDITAGNNGAFSAKSGWDACTGLGSPIGENIVAVLARAASTKKRAARAATA